MWEIGEELWRTGQLTTCSWLAREWTICKRAHEKHMLEAEDLSARRHLATHLMTWPTCEMTTRCTTSCFSVLSSFLYLHYKSSHYPWNWKENFREKTLEMHLKVRDCTPTIIYTFLLVFLYSYLSNYISLRVLNPNTYITQFECCELFWWLWEVLDEVIVGRCNWS